MLYFEDLLNNLKDLQIGLDAAAARSIKKESESLPRRISSYFFGFVDQYSVLKGTAGNTDFSGIGLSRMENREESFEIRQYNASIKPIIG
jgi:hypothetical protein